MSDTFLRADEVVEMTGRVQRSAQARALRALGIIHKVRPDGSLLVLRSHIEKELGGVPAGGRTKEFKPNWEAANA
jgi:hypothetical protein